jgi:hypothetical protein
MYFGSIATSIYASCIQVVSFLQVLDGKHIITVGIIMYSDVGEY